MAPSTTGGPAPTRLRIAIDSRLAAHAPELVWTVATLLEMAGYARDLHWVEPGTPPPDAPFDLFYGPEPAAVPAAVQVRWCGLEPRRVGEATPHDHVLDGDTPLLGFGDAPARPPRAEQGALRYETDVLFASCWWLLGAAEAGYARDRFDNLDPRGSYLAEHGLLGLPGVSLLARDLRRRFEDAGRPAAPPPWGGSVLALSHDVDYPEAIRWIELLRHGRHGAARVRALLGREQPFWRFHDWAALAESLGGRSTFYFMARRGSLLRYTLGDPDGFYDVRAPRYRAVLTELRERGCGIGLHASYRSSQEPERFAAEKARLEEASGAAVEGNRQHYWRLDPAAPHETLRQLEAAGFAYDSSLALELQPGFRRGSCHPFRPFHPGLRRPLGLVEVPPAWMDDHYDGRLAASGIQEPEAHARRLLALAAATGGVAVLDYHVRGMNEAFFPRWGAWLRRLLGEGLPAGMAGGRVGELARGFREHAGRLQAASVEREPAA